MGRPVTMAILRYRDDEVRSPFTADKRDSILRMIGRSDGCIGSIQMV